MNGHDLSRLHRLHTVVGLTRYAKFAADQSDSEVECPKTAYADVTGRKYPCHTKTAAFESALLAADDQVTNPEVLSKLAEFASFWGITQDVTESMAKVAATKVSASPDELSDDEYALVQTHNGQKIRKFASFDVESTVAAAEAFYRQRASFPFAWRKTASERLLATAEKHGVILPAFVDTYLKQAACLGRPTADSVDEGYAQRFEVSHKRDDDVMGKLGTVLDAVAKAPESFDQVKIAAVLDVVDGVDREIKLAQHYDTGRVGLPEEMLVVTPKVVKTASTPIRLMNGQMVDVATLTKEALASVDDSLATMSLAKLAEVLPTLPVPDANLLMHLIPKQAADMGALTDDNFSAQTAPAAMAPPAAAAAPAMPAPAPAAAPAPMGGMVDPMAGAAQNKMAPIASGAASGNFAANGSNMPTNQNEQIAMNQASDRGAGAALGTQHAPVQ